MYKFFVIMECFSEQLHTPEMEFWSKKGKNIPNTKTNRLEYTIGEE